ncbi:MAG: hypothetical protein MUF76_10820 [Hydrogenophaga sp.]|nr:hypothetical protein [Hydrogenophaga sp.]
MSRSRQRISDFEARSVQIIAAFTFSVAGMSVLQPTAAQRASSAAPSTLSAHGPNALASPRNLGQRQAPDGQKPANRNP